MANPTQTAVERIEAVWKVLDERGILRGVGSDLYNEIREDLAAAMQPHAVDAAAMNREQVNYYDSLTHKLLVLGEKWPDLFERGQTISADKVIDRLMDIATRAHSSNALREAATAVRSFCIPGMNWTDEIGQQLLKDLDEALATPQVGGHE